MRRWRFNTELATLILTASAIGLTACSSVSTAVKLKDPSQTAISFSRIGRAAVRPIQPGAADVSVPLGSFDVKGASISRTNQEINLNCPDCVSGNLTLLSEAGLTAAAPTSVSKLIETRKTKANQLSLEYRYTVTSSQNTVPVLETRWSNAEYFQENHEPVRALGWLLAPGGFLTVAGVLLLFSSPTAGILMMVPGVALDVWGAWQLLMSPSSEQVGLDGKEITQPAALVAPKEPAAEEAAPVEKAEEIEPVEKQAAPPSTEKKEGALKAKADELDKEETASKTKKVEQEKKVAEPADEKSEKAGKKKPSASEDEADKNEEKDSKPSKPPSKGKEKKEKLDDFLL